MAHWQVPRATQHGELNYSSGGQLSLLWLAFIRVGVESMVVSRWSLEQLWTWPDHQRHTWEGSGMLLNLLTPAGHGAQDLYNVLCQLCGS